MVDDWAKSWAVPAFEPTTSFGQKAKQVGFDVVANNNITENIKKSAKRLYTLFYPGIAAHYVMQLLRIRDKVQGRNVWSTYYQYVSLKKNLWEYRVFKFTKYS